MAGKGPSLPQLLQGILGKSLLAPQGPEQPGCSQNTGLKEGDCLFQTHFCPARDSWTSWDCQPVPAHPYPGELSAGSSPQLVQLDDDPDVVVRQVHVVEHKGHQAVFPLG